MGILFSAGGSNRQVLMMVVCYGFLFACAVLMAVGLTLMGIAIGDLNATRTTGVPTGHREGGSPVASGTAG